MPQVDTCHTMDLLLELSSIAGQDAGTAVVTQQGKEQGALLVEEGAICWARAHDKASSLKKLLLEQKPAAPTNEELELCLDKCRRNALPLVATLQQELGFSQCNIRAALLKDTAMALRHLAQPGASLNFVPHPQESFSPTHRFSALEVYLETLGRKSTPVVQQAEALLDRLVNEQTSGVVYHIGDWENPMSAQGELAPQPHELPELTGWVRETLDVSSELSSNYPVVILGAGGPVTAVLWRTQGFAALLFCEGDAAVARVLGQTRCRV